MKPEIARRRLVLLPAVDTASTKVTSTPPPAGGGRRPESDLGYRLTVRCPVCASLDDKVVDSRVADEGAAIRRRRECLACGRRFTTFERLEEAPLMVLKRSGHRESFDRAKLVAGIRSATKNRPISAEAIEALASEVEEVARLEGPEVPSQRIGVAALDRLRTLDEVAYLRFASVYKGFEDAGDFEREAGLLVKETAPKHRA